MRISHGFPFPRQCDGCSSAAAALYCRPESAFLCIACDARTHAAVRHDRVWMCEVCEQAPAAVTCRADVAALCLSCDCDIHSANLLASRHERVPVSPFYDTVESVVVRSTAAALLHDVEKPAAAYDAALDFYNYQISSQPFSDSVVPVQANRPENCFEIDFTRSTISSYNNSNYAGSSLSHSISSSSMDVGVVPDSATNPSGNPVEKMDREARVLRYKEKRKNRKFEKTIRYASRKAYAETRPRIKGRFAKRTDSKPDIDQIFSGSFIADSSYGVVPSF